MHGAGVDRPGNDMRRSLVACIEIFARTGLKLGLTARAAEEVVFTLMVCLVWSCQGINRHTANDINDPARRLCNAVVMRVFRHHQVFVGHADKPSGGIN